MDKKDVYVNAYNDIRNMETANKNFGEYFAKKKDMILVSSKPVSAEPKKYSLSDMFGAELKMPEKPVKSSKSMGREI